MFHNAIANNGRMVQPFVVQQKLRNGRSVREFSAHVVNPQIASQTTLEQIHDMLVGAVATGTGRTAIRSRYFDIAGKTGTTVITEGGGRTGHFASFVGYFPADNPQYSIFVGIRNPGGNISGAGVAGTVFRNIAEQIFLRNERLPIESVRVDTTLQRAPRINHGKWQHNSTLLASLQMPVSGAEDATDWVRMQRDSIGNHQPQALMLETGVVPDVRGMGARDALYLLESSGLQVNLNGSGRVVSQSLSPGSRLTRGNRIDIALR
jgi:cell division protein FtsI (penicillin-binding protein 3)